MIPVLMIFYDCRSNIINFKIYQMVEWAHPYPD